MSQTRGRSVPAVGSLVPRQALLDWVKSQAHHPKERPTYIKPGSQQTIQPPEQPEICERTPKMVERVEIGTPSLLKIPEVPPTQHVCVTGDQLAAILAERVMGWRVAPDRFIIGGRRWLPRWRFQPTEKFEDAFRLLDAFAPDEYSMSGGSGVGFQVRVRIGNVIGEARETSKPLAITYAIARAAGIEVEQ